MFKKLAGFQQDMFDLPMPARKVAALLLKDLVEGTFNGQALEVRTSTADLSDCYKVYFDPDPRADKPRYRLVYQETTEGSTGICIVGVAVGRREGLDAYFRASRNLGR